MHAGNKPCQVHKQEVSQPVQLDYIPSLDNVFYPTELESVDRDANQVSAQNPPFELRANHPSRCFADISMYEVRSEQGNQKPPRSASYDTQAVLSHTFHTNP